MSEMEQVIVKPENDCYTEVKLELQIHYNGNQNPEGTSNSGNQNSENASNNGNQNSESASNVYIKKERSGYGNNIITEEKEFDEKNINEDLACNSETPTLTSEASAQYLCHICRTRFHQVSELNQHLNSKHSRSSLQCPHCTCVFNIESDYNTHLLIHNTDLSVQLYSCDVCGEKYAKKELLEAHRVEHKDSSEGLPCFVCGMKLKNKSSLKIHLSKHQFLGPFICEECDKELPSQWSLQQHMKIHTGNSLPCSICGKHFSAPSKLKTHLISHSSEKRHECKICHKRYALSNGLKVHMRLHTGQKDFICPVCAKAFCTSSELKSHSRVHDKNKVKPFKCSDCESAFSLNGQLKVHYARMHSTETPFSCEACNMKFKTKKIWKYHTQTQHADDNNRPHKCSVCDKGFLIKDLLRRHMKCHSGERPYPCQHCDKRFKSNSNLTVHMGYFHKEMLKKSVKNGPHCAQGQNQQSSTCDIKPHKGDVSDIVTESEINEDIMNKAQSALHDGEQNREGTSNISIELSEDDSDIVEENKVDEEESNHRETDSDSDTSNFATKASVNISEGTTEATPEPGQFPCHLCGARFFQVSELNHHLNSDHSRSSLQCPHCTCVFNIESDYNTHLLIHNTDLSVQLYSCDVCDEKYAKKELLEAHRVEHKVSSDGLPCFVCGMKLKNKRSLKIHLSKHQFLGPFTCEECDKELPSQWSLQQHMKIHTGNSLPCSICGKHFSAPSKLKTHLISHSSEKRHECKICHKRYALSNGLKVHMRLHTGQKDFICPVCAKAFCTSSELKSHSRVHDKNKVKPFKCSDCESSFSLNGQLKIHYARMHSTETPFSCEACNMKFKTKKVWKYHTQTQHADDNNRPHKCSVCDKGFLIKDLLRRHMKCHSGERPYPCQHCDKRFKSNSNLTVHIGYFHKEMVKKKAKKKVQKDSVK